MKPSRKGGAKAKVAEEAKVRMALNGGPASAALVAEDDRAEDSNAAVGAARAKVSEARKRARPQGGDNDSEPADGGPLVTTQTKRGCPESELGAAEINAAVEEVRDDVDPDSATVPVVSAPPRTGSGADDAAPAAEYAPKFKVGDELDAYDDGEFDAFSGDIFRVIVTRVPDNGVGGLFLYECIIKDGTDEAFHWDEDYLHLPREKEAVREWKKDQTVHVLLEGRWVVGTIHEDCGCDKYVIKRLDGSKSTMMLATEIRQTGCDYAGGGACGCRTTGGAE